MLSCLVLSCLFFFDKVLFVFLFLSSIKLAQNFTPNETGSGSSGRGILRPLKIWAFCVLDTRKLTLLVLATGCIIIFFLQVVSSVRLFPQFEVAHDPIHGFVFELRAGFFYFLWPLLLMACFSLQNGRNRDLVLLHRLASYLLLRIVRVCVSHHCTIFDCVSYQEFGFSAQQWALCMQRMPFCSSMSTKLTDSGGYFHSLTLSIREEPCLVLSCLVRSCLILLCCLILLFCVVSCFVLCLFPLFSCLESSW